MREGELKYDQSSRPIKSLEPMLVDQGKSGKVEIFIKEPKDQGKSGKNSEHILWQVFISSVSASILL